MRLHCVNKGVHVLETMLALGRGGGFHWTLILYQHNYTCSLTRVPFRNCQGGGGSGMPYTDFGSRVWWMYMYKELCSIHVMLGRSGGMLPQEI